MSGMLQWMAISISEGEGKEVVQWGLCTRVCFDGVELSAGNDEVESLWVRIKGKTNKADILLGVCFRRSSRDEVADEAFCEQLVEVTQLLTLVLVGDFNLPDIWWKYNTAERKQSRRFLECVEDKFLKQLFLNRGRWPH